MSKASRKRWYSRNNKRRVENEQRDQATNSALKGPHSGFGGWQDKTVGDRPTIDQWANPFIYGTNQLYAARYAWILYYADWMAKKIIDIPVLDMLREGFDWHYTGEDANVGTDIIKGIDNECKRLDFTGMLHQALRMERLMGGCAVVRITKGYEGEDTSTPITPDMVDKGDILGYNVITPLFITRVEWEMSPSEIGYGRPKHYYCRDKVYHRSRLLIFDGSPISPYPQIDFAATTTNWNGFGMSVLSPIWDVLMRANGYQQGAYHLSHMASVWFALYGGLKDLKATRQGQRQLDDMRAIMETISQYRAAIIDGDNVDIKQIGANFGSVPDLLMSGLQIVAAAGDIPASRFLSQAPGGLSTDDRAGLENYYNDIAANQKMRISPILESERQYLLNSTFGTNVFNAEDIETEWKPLWNLSDTEKAQVRSLNTQNVLNVYNNLQLSEEWAISELEQYGAINNSPSDEELEEIEKNTLLEEAAAFGDAQVDGDDYANYSRGRIPEIPTVDSNKGIVRLPNVKADISTARLPRVSTGTPSLSGFSHNKEDKKNKEDDE